MYKRQGTDTATTTTSGTNSYVGWCWKAGGSKNTFNVDDVGYATAAAAGLNGGDITPTGASVGTKQGFSIIEFTGSASGTPSISHGLSEAPNFIIQKDTGATTSWRVFMYNGTTWSIMNFDDASGAQGATETAPTSSLFYANGNGNAANTQIAYLWHDVPGLQKFGSYENPSSSEGAFVKLGFKPAILIYKCSKNISSSSGAGDWMIIDTTRSPVNNPSDMNNLSLNENNSEDGYYSASQGAVDILSNGFKIRHPNSSPGGDPGRLYTYAAWAEVPAFSLYGAQANAR